MFNFSKLLVFSLLALFSCSAPDAPPYSAKVSADEAEKLIAATPDLQLVDVRTPREVAAGHFPKAENVDFHSPDFAARMGKMDKSKPIMVYCAVGGRSASAAEMLQKMGFQKVYDLAGGFQDWQAKGKAIAQ